MLVVKSNVDGTIPLEFFEDETRIDIPERFFQLGYESFRKGDIASFKHIGDGENQFLFVNIVPGRISLLGSVERVIAYGRKKPDARLLVKPAGRLDERTEFAALLLKLRKLLFA